MVRNIMKDQFFLAQKSEPATKDDLYLAADLQDTLAANRDRCVGMAANMIGVKKRAIIVHMGISNIVMFNPRITQKKDPYETEEGCLSLPGERETTRYETIMVEYTDINWKKQRGTFSGWAAQIIQHECDHLEGILI